MTAVDQGTRPTPPAPGDSPSDLAEIGMCPYLAAVDGAWRSTTVAREHRCGAVAPPAILAAEKQRRLCLTPEHAQCATFEAARTVRSNGSDRASTLPRPLARTTPVVLDHGRISVTMPAWRSERFSGQAALVLLLGLAFAAILLARLTGGGTPGAIDGATPTPGISAGVSADPTRAGASGRPGGSADPTSGSSSSPAATSDAQGSAQPPTTGTQTYRIKAGDTLIGIAAKFNTTPKAIAKLNGLTNPSALKVGQVLQIP